MLRFDAAFAASAFLQFDVYTGSREAALIEHERLAHGSHEKIGDARRGSGHVSVQSSGMQKL